MEPAKKHSDFGQDDTFEIEFKVGRKTKINREVTKFAVVYVAVIAVVISTFTFLTIFKNLSESSPLLLGAFLILELSAMAWVFLQIKKFLGKVQTIQNQTEGSETASIKISNGKLSVPSQLACNKETKKRLPPGYTDYEFIISEIKDIERTPGSKNSSPYFTVSLAGLAGAEKKFAFLDRIGLEKFEMLVDRLHKDSGLSDERSPFGKSANKLRSKKRYAINFSFIVALVGAIVCFSLCLVYPPVHKFSAALTIFIFGATGALPVSILLKQTILKSFFKAGHGRELPLVLLWLAVTSIVSAGFILVNSQNIASDYGFDTTITSKSRYKNKNRTRYRAHFQLAASNSKYVYFFGEDSTIPVSKSEYKKIKSGQSLVEGQVQIGSFGIPIIERFELKNLKTKNKRSKTSKAKSEIEKKRKKLRSWKAKLPSFGVPDEVSRVKYKNGQVRSMEPKAAGRNHGVAEYYHANGQLYSKITWVEGVKQGRNVIYSEQGLMQQDLSFKDGKLHGLNRWYDASGNLTHSVVYEQGKPLQ